MTNFATLDRERPMSAVLKVVGVGGGGCNAIESMMKRGLSGVEFVAVNTDGQVLESSSAPYKIQIGNKITKGLGAGADPNVGKKALEEDREQVSKVLEGADMVFITAGMGGGTGTGAGPIIASIAKSMGALVVGIVTKPFAWEGKKRMMNAEQGIQELRQYVDSLIVIPNQRLLSLLDKDVTACDAFDKPNEVLYEATRGIADIITITGIINVDFADVRSVMNESGEALIGVGVSTGENRAIEAAQKAISSPLLEGVSIRGAKNILLNVTASQNLTMSEIDAGNKVIYDAAGSDANVIFGWVSKEDMNESVSYTVIATGFDLKKKAEGLDDIAREEDLKTVSGNNSAQFKNQDQDRQYSREDVDLEVPTYLRVTGRKPLAADDEGSDELGYRVDGRQPRADRFDDDDSSSFLRKIMD